MATPTFTGQKRDHGGGLDDAVRRYGGVRADWLDLSTGINPVPYAFTASPPDAWTALPDSAANSALCAAARAFWDVPAGAEVLAVPGASAAIAQFPRLAPAGTVAIPGPTYNEHAAAFRAHGWTVAETGQQAQVIVHPNNPTGQFWTRQDLTASLRIIDESFCDIAPDQSLIAEAHRDDTLILKSFGKFWGLAGVRLGFVIGAPVHLDRLAEWLGPWPVSGVALDIGRQALLDHEWAQTTRVRLAADSDRLDAMMDAAGARAEGGTSLFRLYHVDDATVWQTRLAEYRIWSRTFPYSAHWLRLGLPDAGGWKRLSAAL